MAVADTTTKQPGSAGTPHRASERAARDAARSRPSDGIRALHGVLIAALVVYAISLIIRGQDGASPTWLDGWGVAAFELVCSVLVLARAYASPRPFQWYVAKLSNWGNSSQPGRFSRGTVSWTSTVPAKRCAAFATPQTSLPSPPRIGALQPRASGT